MIRAAIPGIALLLTTVGAVACTGSDPNSTDSDGGTSTGQASTDPGSTGPGSTGESTGGSVTDSGTGGTSTTGVTTTDGSESTSPTSSGGTTGEEPPSAAACAMDGGICIGAGSCGPAGGTVAPSSPGGCKFDDGPAECCVPPDPKPNAMNCTDAGGICAPIGGCLDAGGYFTSNDAGCDMGASFTCCVPHDRCGAQTIECCDGAAVFLPSCDDGMQVCTIGRAVPLGTCL